MEQYKIKEKYRSVCSHCNMPLNELACEAVAEAKADPHFRRLEKLAAEMAALEAKISEITGIEDGDKAVLDTSSALSGEDRAAIDNYAALFGDV